MADVSLSTQGHGITFSIRGTEPMQLYTIYPPAHHKPDKVQATAELAEADHDDAPSSWSVQPAHSPDQHG